MRSLSYTAAMLLLLSSAGAYAAFDCNGVKNCNTDESIHNTNKAYGGDGGDGGKAYSKSYAEGGNAYAKGGNAYQSQKAYGGDAEQDQWQVGINKQGQDQGQEQDQYQKALSLALQKQSNDGNKQTLVIKSKTDVDAEPAIAPAVAPGDPTAPCIATYGGSAAGGGIFAFGVSAYEYDEICGGLEFYRATADSGSKEVEAMRAVTIRATYALLQKKIESELGPDGYASAVGITVEDKGTQSVNLRRDPQGDFHQASYQPNN